MDGVLRQLWQEIHLTNVFSAANLLALTVFVLVFYVLQRCQSNTRYANIPPGPKPWPVVGNFGGFLVPSFILRRFGHNPEELRKRDANPLSPQAGLTEMAKVYGNIFSIFVGPQLIVVLTGYDAVRDALSNHADAFSDRPEIPLITIITKRKGIVFAPYGPLWRTNRKFCLSTLRSFGFGKLSLEPCIHEGLTMIKTELQSLTKKAGASGVNLTPLISNAVSNVISLMSLGQRFHHQDQEFRTMLDLMAHGLEISVSSPILLINIFPWLYYLPCGVFKELRRVELDITAFLKKIIARHRATLDPENPRDFIDMYLVEMLAQQAAGTSSEKSMFSEDDLFYIIGDLFIAEKVQQEIGGVVGSGRVPSLADKGSLPYTEATIMEVQRMTVVVPLSIPHMASETTEFRGYTIPKGTVIIPNLWSVHRDPTVWENPDDFNPSRFLDEQGKLLRKDCFIPFGIGRRVCMGEQLAKMELFVMFSSLMQAFTFRLPEGTPPPPMNGRFGLTLAPCPFTVCATAR
ncbi:cytochrome P450 2U1-like isoform X2 [Myxocyprinus asiaticus]|uniref:cytochrome P450 2U1-like isoform X2 n=1 Tax=Myxocyprinus asiaticus TaxID=70543 RepID=UPI002223864F|nr:cytochrome P450 2U1-like isoform X2 [Myxocyprinus asiaticus]